MASHSSNKSLDFTDFKGGDRKQREGMCIIHTFDSLPQICIDLSFDLPPMQYWKTGRLQNTAALQILGLQKLAGLLTSFRANLYSFYRTHHACL